jgi:UDP-2,4-diacetamido-2,4,6-trideoxy-beta-L-altropyranose hydrolase
MRCIALGQAWKRRGGEVFFCTWCASHNLLKRIAEEEFTLIRLKGSQPDGSAPEEPLKALWRSGDQDSAWVLLDGYAFGLGYQRAVRERAKRLLVIDDYNHFPRYESDILLNHNIEAEHFRYQANKECKFLLGPRYALLRGEFLQTKESKQIPIIGEKILVTMGGSDPERVTLKILEGLCMLKELQMQVKIVVGPANPYGAEVKSKASKSDLRCEILEASREMPRLMSWADSAVTAGGGTCMELAFMGVPFLVVAVAENQKQVMSGFANKGAAVALGWHADVEPRRIATEINALMKDRSRREGFSGLGQALVDGLGAWRVTEVMDPTRVALRRVQDRDCEILWQWANEPRTRAVSFSSTPIPWEDHRRWFAEKLCSEKCLFYIATNQYGVPLGQARFDLEQSGPVISVSLDHDFRSLGLGSELIRVASEQAMKERDLGRIDAFIKKDNLLSLRAFSKAGYKNVTEEMRQGCAAQRLTYRGESPE